MNGHRRPRPRSPRRPHRPHCPSCPPHVPGDTCRPAVVRQGERGQFELAISPGARVADLVAAAGTLPRHVVYVCHRPAAPGDAAAVLVFQAAPPEAAGQPLPLPADGAAPGTRAGTRR